MRLAVVWLLLLAPAWAEFREKLIRIPLASDGFRLANGSKPLLEAALIPGELYPELSAGGIERYPGADLPDAPFEPATWKRGQ